MFNLGVWSEAKTMPFTEEGGISRVTEESLDNIQVVALDEVIDDAVTFIKMDVEGAEYEALKGSERIIKQYSPRLAISIYHKPEDIVEIPRLLKMFNPEYKLYIRHYSNCWADTVLYAI